MIDADDDMVRYRVLCDRCEVDAKVVPAQAGIQWSASDDWVPAYAGMTDTSEAHS
ncbi:MAG: hypothetical protein NTU79_19195 [Planctomycetota bacterium]|nr:hypothetical protein [Planctomycetota bacterium]